SDCCDSSRTATAARRSRIYPFQSGKRVEGLRVRWGSTGKSPSPFWHYRRHLPVTPLLPRKHSICGVSSSRHLELDLATLRHARFVTEFSAAGLPFVVRIRPIPGLGEIAFAEVPLPPGVLRVCRLDRIQCNHDYAESERENKRLRRWFRAGCSSRGE